MTFGRHAVALETSPGSRSKDTLNAAFLDAIERGLRKEADALKAQVDWQAFDALRSPVGKVLCNKRWGVSFFMLLEYARRRVAEKAFSDYDFGKLEVKATGFWSNISQKIYRNLLIQDGVDTFRGEMEIDFRPGCAIPLQVCARRMGYATGELLEPEDDSKIGAFNHDLNSLLPYAAIGCISEEMPFFALDVMRWCVDHGRSDLVCRPFVAMSSNQPVLHEPIYECVSHRLAQGVLLCMEQGVDPYSSLAKANHGSALDAAETRGLDEIILLIKSFKSRTLALDAVREIASLMGASPVQTRLA